MSEKFLELPPEKQNRIINGAISVFAKYDYKKASTDDIVKNAGISKGSLFYYFKNKKDLYLYMYNYAMDYLVKTLSSALKTEETDFFEILINSNIAKLKILSQYPDMMNFVIKSYYEECEAVKSEIDKRFSILLAQSSIKFLERIDTKKFKDEVSVEKALNIFVWMADGYMRSRTADQLTDLPRVTNEFIEYINILKRQFYKKEFI